MIVHVSDVVLFPVFVKSLTVVLYIEALSTLDIPLTFHIPTGNGAEPELNSFGSFAESINQS